MWKPLNKQGQGSYDPWPYISNLTCFDESRNEIVAQEVARHGFLQAKIVDFGCGDGRTLAHLAALGATDLHGIDHSEEGLRRTRKRVPNATTRWADLLNLEAVECDVAVCTEVLEHLPTDTDVRQVLSLLFSSLFAGGLAIISIPDDAICEIDSDHRRLFTPEDPVALLGDAGFVDVRTVDYFYSESYPWPWMTALGFKATLAA